jgi:predicted amidohydrolase
MNVHLVQLDIAWEDPAANRGRVGELVDAVAPAAGDLVVLPETAFTGFSLDPSRTMIDTDAAEGFLADLARRLRCTVVGGLVAPDQDGRASNQSLAFSPAGDLLARYVKLQPFTLGGEAAVHAAGGEIVLFEWAGLRVAPLICYDLRFPEHFRAAAKLGAEMFVVIANWPAKRHHHWLTLLKARAIENQAAVVGVNRCGTDPSFTYNGRSIVASPHGHVIADAGEQERVVTARIDADEIRRWRREFPALGDMR